MKRWMIILAVLAVPMLQAQAPVRVDYKSPYKVKFSFSEEDLIGDLLTGSRSAWKEHAAVPFKDWYDKSNQARWSYRGPAAKHFDPPRGLGTKSVEWTRQRVIAAGLRFVGYSYQHHHVPDWDPPEDWPRDAAQKTPPGKGLDCSNFTAFVYNWALGIKPTGDVRQQAELKEMPGPGAGRSFPVRRLELPKEYEDYQKELKTGDLLFINNSSGKLSHVVLWVGSIGVAPDGVPLILDSTGSGNYDCNRAEIPDGIYLRPFKPNSWYFKQASHGLRVIPDGK